MTREPTRSQSHLHDTMNLLGRDTSLRNTQRPNCDLDITSKTGILKRFATFIRAFFFFFARCRVSARGEERRGGSRGSRTHRGRSVLVGSAQGEWPIIRAIIIKQASCPPCPRIIPREASCRGIGRQIMRRTTAAHTCPACQRR